jgi:hypothetical protein
MQSDALPGLIVELARSQEVEILMYPLTKTWYFYCMTLYLMLLQKTCSVLRYGSPREIPCLEPTDEFVKTVFVAMAAIDIIVEEIAIRSCAHTKHGISIA